jgi:hypothetical protein
MENELVVLLHSYPETEGITRSLKEKMQHQDPAVLLGIIQEDSLLTVDLRGLDDYLNVEEPFV